jgi:hypothetical protein
MRLKAQMALVLFGVSAIVAGTSCSTPEAGDVLAVEAIGGLTGVVYFDANTNRVRDSSDPGLEGITIWLSRRGARTPIVPRKSGATGGYMMDRVPVGDYWMNIDTVTLGDSLIAFRSDTLTVAIRPGVTTTWDIGLTFANVTIAEARTLPVGQKVTIEGFALNDRSAFGDSTVHVSEGATAIRATNVFRANVRQGDSVRLTGRTGIVDGQPVIDRVTSQILATTGTPTPVIVTTANARTAVGGTADANHVQVRSATIVDTTTTAEGDRLLDLDDGSGVVEVLLDVDIPFLLTPLLPDSTLTRVTGVLVPTGSGTWRLKPRAQVDIVR